MPLRTYTVAAARALLPELLELSREFVALRADTTELAGAIRQGEQSPLGGPAEYKAGEARVHEVLEWFVDRGLEPKGLAPLLIDFPAEFDGNSVLLCWLEGEQELAWYHRPEFGFSGRRPIPTSWA